MIEERIDLYKKYMNLVNREGKENLLNWLVNDTDFFTAPASSKFHNNYEGGLFKHSVNVLEYARNLNSFSNRNFDFPEISLESIIITALHHDLCKVNFYVKDKLWVKDNKQWLQYDGVVKAEELSDNGYKIEDNFPLGHGEKSLVYLLQHIKLSNEEMLAIRYHMGRITGTTMEVMPSDQAFKYPLVYLLYVADVCTGMVEKTIDYKQIAINNK